MNDMIDTMNTKTQINQIAFQLKYIKTMEANSSRLGMNELVKTFRQQRNQLTKSLNELIGHADSIKYGNRRWLSNITSGLVKPYGRAVNILAK